MLNADHKSADKTAANNDILNFKNRRNESAECKRKIIYLFSKGGAAFEIRLSTQESLGKCIMFLRTVLPESAAIKEDAGR